MRELRIYRCLPGRLKDVIDRFENVVMPLWREHGIDPIGFWTVVVGSSSQDLYYMIRWKSMAEREEKWARFQSDSRWIEHKRNSEANGPMVGSIENLFLSEVPFSREMGLR